MERENKVGYTILIGLGPEDVFNLLRVFIIVVRERMLLCRDLIRGR